MPSDHKIKVSAQLTINGRTVTVSESGTLTLSGDRRQWPRQIEAHIAEMAHMVSVPITERAKGADTTNTRSGRSSSVQGPSAAKAG